MAYLKLLKPITFMYSTTLLFNRDANFKEHQLFRIFPFH